MKIDWHAGIMLLFVLSSLFFLGKALANKRSGKPFRWKIGNLLFISLSKNYANAPASAIIEETGVFTWKAGEKMHGMSQSS